MNVNLLVMVIILYIFKNNNRQYSYAKNNNQNLLLLLLFINERNQRLNNKYNYKNLINNNGYYMNYPNHALGNSNCIKNISKDTSINNNEDNMINTEKYITINNDDNLTINSNKTISKNTDKDDIINIDKDILSDSSNDNSIDTNKNNNNDTTINNNKDNLINSNKTISKNTDKKNITNIDKDIINDSSNEHSIDTNKNKNEDDALTINDNKDNLINSNKTSSKNTDKDDIINEDNYILNDSSNLKNKFIKAATKIHNKSLTYKNPYKKNYKISISNTLKQLPLAKATIDINKFTNNFNIKPPAPLTDVKAKAPVLVGSTKITEVFNGKVTFCNPIISILKVTNEIFITSKSISPPLNSNDNNAILHYEGFLKTHLEYLEDVIIEQYQIKCDSKHYIMIIPFSGSKELNVSNEVINSPNIVLQDFTLDINKSTFSVATCLEEPAKGNKYINLYKICNLTVKVDCDISLYRKKLVHL